MLAHPIPHASLRISSDASDCGVGAVLEQNRNGTWQPLAFFSRHLSSTEKNYSTFDKELLVAYLAVRHFQPMIEGRNCILATDHKPLSEALGRHSDPWSPRQQRHLSALSELLGGIIHRSGVDNTVADCLSRGPVAAISLTLNYNDLAMAQSTCPDLTMVRSWPSLQLEDRILSPGLPPVTCDVSLGHPRPFVPASLRRTVLTCCMDWLILEFEL
jgi:hypothetical protein